MAGLITVGGLATGIDTNSIIDQLVKLEHRPVDLLAIEVGDVQATQASITTLTGKLSTLAAAAHGLRILDEYRGTMAATDLRARVAGLGVDLARLGLRGALAAQSPACRPVRRCSSCPAAPPCEGKPGSLPARRRARSQRA